MADVDKTFMSEIFSSYFDCCSESRGQHWRLNNNQTLTEFAQLPEDSVNKRAELIYKEFLHDRPSKISCVLVFFESSN